MTAGFISPSRGLFQSLCDFKFCKTLAILTEKKQNKYPLYFQIVADSFKKKTGVCNKIPPLHVYFFAISWQINTYILERSFQKT